MNWGIIGLGKMGNQFAKSILDTNNSKLIAVSSKSKKKLDTFSNEFNINKKNLFLSYDDLISNKDVQAVYISTLNNTHLDLIHKAALKNKKILCEKPISMNLEETIKAREIIKKYKVKFFEAIAYRSHPQTKTIFELIKSNQFGKIKKIEARFGFKVKRIRPDSRLFNKKLGGGSILDLGCYPISFFNLFVDDKKKFEIIDRNIEISETGVDIDAKIYSKIGSNIETFGHVSLKENLENKCKIFFENGSIILSNPWLPGKKSLIEVQIGKHYYKKTINSEKDVYSNQIENITNLFIDQNSSRDDLFINIDKSVEIMEIIDKWKNC